MKTPFVKMIAVSTIIFFAIQSNAQLAMNSTQSNEAKQRITVDFKITPSVAGFRAGVSLIDSIQNKFRLWVNNSEEKRFTISIYGGSGYLWSSNYKDAYFNQVFDLSSLDDGEYTVKVICDKNYFEKKIFLSSVNYTTRELRVQ